MEKGKYEIKIVISLHILERKEQRQTREHYVKLNKIFT
jgi:hypothetical protein